MTGSTETALHLVTDDRVLAGPDLRERARAALEAGGAAVTLHLRGPGTGGRLLHDLGVALVAAARAAGSRVVVNDRVDVGLAIGADGVHLPGRSFDVAGARALLPAGSVVGASVHSVEAALERADADLLLVGTIFATASHPGRPAAGPELVSRVREVSRSPVVAIGGVTPDRVPTLLAAGADGVAVLSGVWDAADPAEAVEAYLRRLGGQGP